MIIPLPSPPALPYIPTVESLDYQVLQIAPRLADLDIPNLTVLNLGAGNGEGTLAEQIRELPFARLDNVEVFTESLHQLSIQYTAAESADYFNEDALGFVKRQSDKSYDVCIMFDFLEHLTRNEAWELIGELKRVCKKRILLFLPFGETRQDAYGGNDWQLHKSTWTPDDFALPDVEVDICWRHWHVENAPFAGFVSFNLA